MPHQFPSTGSCPFAGQKSHVALIHVGKTAGMTVENLLSLAGVNHTQVHTKNAHVAVDCHFTHYIVTTRDPINRTISAFNWRCEPRWRATIEWRDLGGAAGALAHCLLPALAGAAPPALAPLRATWRPGAGSVVWGRPLSPTGCTCARAVSVLRSQPSDGGAPAAMAQERAALAAGERPLQRVLSAHARRRQRLR